MAASDLKKWRRLWYVAGSLLVIELLILLALNPKSAAPANSVTLNLRSWKLSGTLTEKPEREGRIRVTRTICVGPITYRGQSFDSVMAREERGATP
jgi:hypothetical protein